MSVEPVVAGFTTVNVEDWSRKEVYDFYKDGAYPLWGVTVRLDVTKARRVCKEQGWKYLQASLYLMTLAVNQSEALRYRIRTDEKSGEKLVICHDMVHASCPIMRPDDTYGFCVFESNPSSFADYRDFASRALEEYHSGQGLNKSPRDDILHGSILPWIDFTSYEHATGRTSRPDIPKYVFGKLVHDTSSDTWSQSFCLHIHHALADGLHVGRFMEAFQRNLDQAEDLLMT